MAKSGQVTSLLYDGSGRLVAVVNAFGRQLTFAYDGAGRLANVTLPDGSSLAYSYDGPGNLAGVRFADGSLRQYAYENPTFPSALTGVIDESGRRRVTWGYDSSGQPNQGYYGNGLNGVSIPYHGHQGTPTHA